ncbi:MAG: helix-turn-helix domain-containing protein [Streptococcaceae bacterium]|jgi:hypothetical protein|nr:helix-turn-helix domain-containing protein [Streptococcaceae bacterium]
MIGYLDTDDYEKIRILYYLENHRLTNVMYEDISEDLNLTLYQVKKNLIEIKDEIEQWGMNDYYQVSTFHKKSYVKYARKTQSNIIVLVNEYAKRATMQLLVQAVLTESTKNMFDLEEALFVSRATTYKLIKKFTELSNNYDLRITKATRFEGDEWNIREFVYHFYNSLYGSLSYPFSDEVMGELSSLLEGLLRIPNLLSSNFSSQDKNKLLYRLFVIYIRNYFHHYTKAQPFMRVDSVITDQIKEVLATKLEGTPQEILEEAYELQYFMVSEQLIDTIDLPKLEIVDVFGDTLLQVVESELPKFFEDLNTESVKEHLRQIHTRLIVSKRTNFDTALYHDFSYIDENYQIVQDMSYAFVQKLMTIEGYEALVEEKYEALVREYVFLLINRIPIDKLSPRLKLSIDFSYGQGYNNYILKNIQSLTNLNLDIRIGKSELPTDVYLSNSPDKNNDGVQIIWSSPPSAYDWEFLGNTLIQVRKSRGNG